MFCSQRFINIRTVVETEVDGFDNVFIGRLMGDE